MNASNAPSLNLPALQEMEQHAGDAERLMRTLANRHRLMILCALVNGELSVGEINELVPLSQSALSQHLAVMRNEGLVGTRRDGQTVYYSVSSAPALGVLQVLHDSFCVAPTSTARRRKSRENKS